MANRRHRIDAVIVQIVRQKVEDILGSLRHLEVNWRDETAIQVIGRTIEERTGQRDFGGDITRIYTYAMADQFERDLRQLKSDQLKSECGL